MKCRKCRKRLDFFWQYEVFPGDRYAPDSSWCTCEEPDEYTPLLRKLRNWWSENRLAMWIKTGGNQCGMCGTPVNRKSNICQGCYTEEKFGYLRDEAWQ